MAETKKKNRQQIIPLILLGAVSLLFALQEGPSREGLFFIVFFYLLSCFVVFSRSRLGILLLSVLSGTLAGAGFQDVVFSGRSIAASLFPPFGAQVACSLVPLFFSLCILTEGKRVANVFWQISLGAMTLVVLLGPLNKPQSVLLERASVFQEETGVIVLKEPMFAVQDEHGAVYAARPGAIGTPFTTIAHKVLGDFKISPAYRVVGVFPEKSEFLPMDTKEKKIPIWTYLGGAKSAISPLTLVRTDHLSN